MGRAGTLPLSFGRISPKHLTPTFAITIATLAVIVFYVMPNLALTRHMRREQPAKFTVWQHAVVPWIATLALLPVLFVTVYPEPSWPYNLTPYLFLVVLFAGFVYMQLARVSQSRSTSQRRNNAHSKQRDLRRRVGM